MATLLEELMYVCVRVVGRVYVAMKWERQEVCCNGGKNERSSFSALILLCIGETRVDIYISSYCGKW